ncbi:MAG: ABC transporter substrate-binding protein [Candidatus Thermoplasmatota archaeon]|nr:ABC transporter substrate-binding protein [Candidatus Thermoplasmatota archaeon]
MNMNYKKNITVAIAIVLIVASFIGGYFTYMYTSGKSVNGIPSTNNTSNRSITIIDDTGRVITIHGIPQRIVSLAPSNTEILFDLNLRNKLVGIDSIYDYTTAQVKEWGISNVTQVTTSTNINYEEILNLTPDLVLAAGITSPAQVYKLTSLGLTVVVLNPENMHQILNDIYLVGLVCGTLTTAKTIISNLSAMLTHIETTVGSVYTKPSVLLTYYPDNYSMAYWTYGPGSFGNRLIIDAGGYNIASNLSLSYPEISVGSVVNLNPSFIMVGVGPYGLNITSYSSFNPTWINLSAVKNNTIYGLNDAYISEPDISLFYVLQEMAYILHPSLFNLTGNVSGRLYNGNTPQTSVTIKLLNATNTVVATTDTNATGGYQFTGIPCGSYKMEIIYNGKIYYRNINIIYLNMVNVVIHL